MRYIAALATLLTLGIVGLTISYLWLPDPDSLREKNPLVTAYINLKCSSSCTLAWTPLSEISPFMVRGAVIAEDQGFYRHGGVSFPTVWRAFKRNIQERRFAWGGSTITMQLARNLYLYPEKTIQRKIFEVLLSFKLERALTKNRILEIYLNVAEWGPDIFGITAASRHHFDKLPSELGPLEASFLASILPSPIRSREDTLRSQFRERGSIIFDRLVSPYLPKAKRKDQGSDPCDDPLDEDEARSVDTLGAELISRFGVSIASGDGSLLTREKIDAVLNNDQKQFLTKLTHKLNSDRPALFCRRNLSEEETNLVEWQQNKGASTYRYWIPVSSLPALQRLMFRAEEDGIALRLSSAYRASGYQLYLLLRELRLQNYCLSKTRKIIESPDRSEHACLDTGALDFASIEDGTSSFEDTKAYRWLRENAPDLGFQLSYEQDNSHGIDFEAWHWRYKPDGAQR